MPVGVFISYNHKDRQIADALKRCLNAISGELNVFIDHASLIMGEKYEPALARSIANSQWFLMISSGPPRPEKDMGWCLMEAGQFVTKMNNENRASMTDEDLATLIKSRLITIHDYDRPKPLSPYESAKIATTINTGAFLDLNAGTENLSPFESTDAYKMFANIIKHSAQVPLRDLTDRDVRFLVCDQARNLIRAFVEFGEDQLLTEVVLQPRISFRLPPGAVGMTDDIIVTGYDSALRDIFTIVGAETTWGNIKQLVREADGNDPLWITDVEDAASQVSRDTVPEQPDGLCRSVMKAEAPLRFYRVLFGRYVPSLKGFRTCYVSFVASRPRQFDIRKKSSILLSAIILSIRFRQRILPYIETIGQTPRATKLQNLLALERALHQVETEAIEFGLVLPAGEDETPLMQVMRDGDKKEFMKQTTAEWTVSRQALGAAIIRLRRAGTEEARTEALGEAERIVTGELQKIRTVNGKFIKILAEELMFLENLEHGD